MTRQPTFLSFANVRIAALRLAPDKFAPVRSALVKFEPYSVAPVTGLGYSLCRIAVKCGPKDSSNIRLKRPNWNQATQCCYRSEQHVGGQDVPRQLNIDNWDKDEGDETQLKNDSGSNLQ